MSLGATLEERAKHGALLGWGQSLAVIDVLLHPLKLGFRQDFQCGEFFIMGHQKTKNAISNLRAPISRDGNAAFRVHLIRVKPSETVASGAH